MDKILESEKTFTLKALLIRPSQKVVAYVACENIGELIARPHRVDLIRGQPESKSKLSLNLKLIEHYILSSDLQLLKRCLPPDHYRSRW